MKNNRHGKSAILSNVDYTRIRKSIVSSKYKILLDIAWFTGERWGALIQLKFNDVFNPDGSVREEITFKARTRKASPDGKKRTRQIVIHSTLVETLKNYKQEIKSEWLFPNRENNGPITLRAADKILRLAVEKAGLSPKGISTHSTRRSFITKLHQNGTDLYTIKKITGHKDLKCLESYVDINTNQIKGAIETL